MCGELVQFDKYNQTKIYELGRRMNRGDHVERILAEGDLIKFVRNLATTIDQRKVVTPVIVAQAATKEA